MAKDEEVEWRRMRRLNGIYIFITSFIIYYFFLIKSRKILNRFLKPFEPFFIRIISLIRELLL